MARISTYELDNNITGDEKILISDSDGPETTLNMRVDDLKTYIEQNLNISESYTPISPLAGDELVRFSNGAANPGQSVTVTLPFVIDYIERNFKFSSYTSSPSIDGGRTIVTSGNSTDNNKVTIDVLIDHIEKNFDFSKLSSALTLNRRDKMVFQSPGDTSGRIVDVEYIQDYFTDTFEYNRYNTSSIATGKQFIAIDPGAGNARQRVAASAISTYVQDVFRISRYTTSAITDASTILLDKGGAPINKATALDFANYVISKLDTSSAPDTTTVEGTDKLFGTKAGVAQNTTVTQLLNYVNARLSFATYSYNATPDLTDSVLVQNAANDTPTRVTLQDLATIIPAKPIHYLFYKRPDVNLTPGSADAVNIGDDLILPMTPTTTYEIDVSIHVRAGSATTTPDQDFIFGISSRYGGANSDFDEDIFKNIRIDSDLLNVAGGKPDPGTILTFSHIISAPVINLPVTPQVTISFRNDSSNVTNFITSVFTVRVREISAITQVIDNSVTP